MNLLIVLLFLGAVITTVWIFTRPINVEMSEEDAELIKKVDEWLKKVN